jgi:methylenetetrahydrofolate dehydrogenase (NADP+)/methenyltetrahydrofolate cyclohydrolase
VKLLDGRAPARTITDRLTKEVADLAAAGTVPTVAIVLVGDDPGAEWYARSLGRAAAMIGARFRVERLAVDDGQARAAEVVGSLGDAPDVHGILLQAPLPPGYDRAALADLIPAGKDIDGSSSESLGRLLLGRDGHRPATAAAVVAVLDEHGVDVAGKRVVVVGRSPTVGKPAALLLLARDATVTLCHSRTPDLAATTRGADILVVAVGRPRVIGAAHVGPGAVLVDVGINELDGGIVGDVDAEAVAGVAGALTPVPGGIGPLTTAILLSNLVAATNPVSGDKGRAIRGQVSPETGGVKPGPASCSTPSHSTASPHGGPAGRSAS